MRGLYSMTGYICIHGYLYSQCNKCIEFEAPKDIESDEEFLNIIEYSFPDYKEIIERTKKTG